MLLMTEGECRIWSTLYQGDPYLDQVYSYLHQWPNTRHIISASPYKPDLYNMGKVVENGIPPRKVKYTQSLKIRKQNLRI